MKIETTITAEKNGVILFETNCVAHIDHHLDRYGELEWHVDQYTVESTRREWDDTAARWRERKIEAAVPDKLAEVFNEFLDRDWMAEKIREELAANSYDASDAAYDNWRDR